MRLSYRDLHAHPDRKAPAPSCPTLSPRFPRSGIFHSQPGYRGPVNRDAGWCVCVLSGRWQRWGGAAEILLEAGSQSGQQLQPRQQAGMPTLSPDADTSLSPPHVGRRDGGLLSPSLPANTYQLPAASPAPSCSSQPTNEIPVPFVIAF